MKTITDPAGNQANYTDGDCGNSFMTSVSLPLGLSRRCLCIGGSTIKHGEPFRSGPHTLFGADRNPPEDAPFRKLVVIFDVDEMPSVLGLVRKNE